MQETGVQSLGWEYLPEKEMAASTSVLAWKILPGQRRLAGYGPWSCKESDRTEAAKQQSIPLYVHITSTLLVHLVIDV